LWDRRGNFYTSRSAETGIRDIEPQKGSKPLWSTVQNPPDEFPEKNQKSLMGTELICTQRHLIISPTAASKIGEALEEALRLADERYVMSDLYENPIPMDHIQREGPEVIDNRWESVRWEVAAINRATAFELLRVIEAGMEAFDDAEVVAASVVMAHC
jgi:hypothetical protein